jgi:hypothetical protein
MNPNRRRKPHDSQQAFRKYSPTLPVLGVTALGIVALLAALYSSLSPDAAHTSPKALNLDFRVQSVTLTGKPVSLSFQELARELEAR